MEIVKKNSSVSNGLTFGLIGGFIYCISLYVRYNFFIANPIMFAVIALLFYLVVIGSLVFCGLTRKKQLGGYIETKEAFQTIFIAVLVAELIYVAFNFIYLKYVDPGYFEKFKAGMISYIENLPLSDAQKEKQLDAIEKQLGKQQEKLNFSGLVFTYLLSIAITGVLGLIVSLIIRKRKPAFDQIS